MVGRGGLRGRARKHIDMGKRYENGIQRSALSPKANYPLPFSRIALLIIWRNILLQALCNITRNYFGPIDLDRFRSSRTFAILKVILIRSFKRSEIDSYDLKLSRWSLECYTAVIFNSRTYHVPWKILSFLFHFGVTQTLKLPVTGIYQFETIGSCLRLFVRFQCVQKLMDIHRRIC